LSAGPGAYKKAPDDEDYDAYVGRIARGVGMSSAGQGVGRVIGYMTQVAIARFHGPAQLGFYALGITVVQVANILSQFGMDNGVVRYVAHHLSRGDTSRVRGTIFQSLAVTFGLSVVFSAAIFFGAGFLADEVFGKPFMETIFRAFAPALPFFTLMSMTLWATQGFHTVKYATYVREVLRPLANLVLVVGFYLAGVQILGAIAAYILSFVLGSVLALFYLRKLFPQLMDRSVRPEYESRALFAVSGPMIVANFTQYINLWTAVVVLGIFEPAPIVGIYDVAARTATLSTLVLVAFGGIFSPMISSLYQQGQLSDLSYLYKDVSRWAFTGALVFFLSTALLAPDIMAVFGEQFVPGWPVIVVIAAAQLFNSSVGPTVRILAMTGRQTLVMYSTVAASVAAVALNFLLVPRFGLMGAAFATAAALILANTMTLFFVRRTLGFWPYGSRYARPLAAGLGAAAVVYGAQLTLEVGAGIPSLAVFGGLFLALFAGLLVLLGLSPSDRQFLAAFWSAVRNNLRRLLPGRG
jgi:O-antigen/teichoic acid export membrane protein